MKTAQYLEAMDLYVRAGLTHQEANRLCYLRGLLD